MSENIEKRNINKKLIKYGVLLVLFVGIATAVYLYLTTTFTVSFLTGCDAVVGTQQVQRYGTAVKPEEPIRDGYKFICWTYNGSSYNFSKKVEKDIVLIAKWQEIIACKYIEFDQSTYNVAVGETVDFEYSIMPDECNEDVLASSQFENIATIDVKRKQITGVAEGTSEVYVTCGEMIHTAKVNVLPCIEELSFDSEEYSVFVGEPLQLNPTLEPGNAYGKVSYKSSDESIATVDENGKVFGVEEGECIITVKSSSGIEKQLTVNVEYSGVESLTITVDAVYLDISTYPEYTINVVVSAAKNSDKTLTYTSSNTDVATVDQQGNITAKGIGSCTVKVTAGNGTSDRIPVYVDYTADEITIGNSEYSVNVGEALCLADEITFEPAACKDAYDIEWYSSDENVTVDENGVVTGVKATASATAITVVFSNYTDNFNRLIYVYCNGGEVVAYGLKDAIVIGSSISLSSNKLMIHRYENGVVASKDIAFDSNCKLVSNHDLLTLNLGKLIVKEDVNTSRSETFHFEYENYRSQDYSIIIEPDIECDLFDQNNCTIKEVSEDNYTVFCSCETGSFTLKSNCNGTFSVSSNEVLSVVSTTDSSQYLTFDFSENTSSVADIILNSKGGQKIKVNIVYRPN